MDELSNLIARAREGDKDAYGQIYQLFYKRIYRYCHFNLSRNETAQDVCQETFLRAWRSISSFSQKKGGSFQAFLFKIARNLIIDLSRKKKEVSIENYEQVDANQDLDEKLQKQEDIEGVRSALAKLEEKDREIVVLRYFEEMSSFEVAKVVGMREGNLRVRTHRILKKLKEIIQSQND